jgi:AcrR family transcriptional regulator
MRRRAELVDETRQRIIEAAARLHTSIGPAATTIAAIADEAGVTRLTVYRHFPNLDELFAACQAHWLSQSRPPDPSTWLAIPDPGERARHALDALYRWFAAHADELYPILRDFAAMPETARRRNRAGAVARAQAILGGPDANAPAQARAAAGHVTSYWTWRSLALEQGLAHEDAVDLAVRFLMAAEPEPGAP